MPEEDHESRHSSMDGPESTEDRQFNVAEMMVGTAMMFVGFLNVLLSISGGFEFAGVTPMLLYFAGMAIWAHAVIRHPSLRYAVMTSSIAVGLAFFHYGEVLFWHKQVVFWGTVLLVVFFMFKTAEPTPPK
ncbi:MAG: hypothetical protein ACREJU_08655 [Nitrospiraceae bacterium]